MDMTATEVRMRIAEWERVNQPKYVAWLERRFEIVWGGFLQELKLWTQDQDLQQQRMTDDGCPLFAERV
jgi:hypothetical protein